MLTVAKENGTVYFPLNAFICLASPLITKKERKKNKEGM